MRTGRLPRLARSFFEGPIYPIITCLIVLIGSITETEFIFNIFNIAMMCAALLLVDSALSLLVPLVTFIYQISVENTPGYPTFSDYYFTGWRVPVLIILAFFLVLSIGIFLIRKDAPKKLFQKRVPLLIPLLILSAVWLVNGILYDGFALNNFLFALAQIFAYFGLFVIFSVGLSEKDDEERIGNRIAYSTLLITLVILIELIARYISISDHAFDVSSIDKLYLNLKNNVLLGWGVCNPIGVSAAVLIPMNFWGAMRTKHHFIYFAGGVLAFLAAIMTMSRNAMLFGSIALVACLAIACFKAARAKPLFCISLVSLFVFALALTILMHDQIAAYMKDIFALGDNGRYAIWAEGIKKMGESPLFGVGFWNVPSDAYEVASFLPPFSHQTFVELLAATGIIGLAAYLFYRAKSALPFILRPTLLKTMLGISILILLFESLLDNYIFYIYPMIYYNAALASAFHLDKKALS